MAVSQQILRPSKSSKDSTAQPESDTEAASEHSASDSESEDHSEISEADDVKFAATGSVFSTAHVPWIAHVGGCGFFCLMYLGLAYYMKPEDLEQRHHYAQAVGFHLMWHALGWVVCGLVIVGVMAAVPALQVPQNGTQLGYHIAGWCFLILVLGVFVYINKVYHCFSLAALIGDESEFSKFLG